MANIKLTDLSRETLSKLGYADPAQSRTNDVKAWARQQAARVATPQVREFGKRLSQRFASLRPEGADDLKSLLKSQIVLTALGVFLLLYVFFSYCNMLICKKAGTEPGVLVWVPVWQLIPMLRAARMSGWWFLGYFVPVLNLILPVVWCFKIAVARGKSAWVGFLLLLPGLGLLAFLYLAFSDATPKPEKRERRVEIMTLETA
jgi:hypothetical protein